MKAPEKKKVGRPATGKDPLLGVRMPPALLAEIDRWRGKVSRSEAVRELVRAGMRVQAAPEGRPEELKM